MCSLSYVHVYCIEYVSYRQGPYRIRIVSAADRIVPALIAGPDQSLRTQIELSTKHSSLLYMCGNFTFIQKISILFTLFNTLQDFLNVLT